MFWKMTHLSGWTTKITKKHLRCVCTLLYLFRLVSTFRCLALKIRVYSSSFLSKHWKFRSSRPDKTSGSSGLALCLWQWLTSDSGRSCCLSAAGQWDVGWGMEGGWDVGTSWVLQPSILPLQGSKPFGFTLNIFISFKTLWNIRYTSSLEPIAFISDACRTAAVPTLSCEKPPTVSVCAPPDVLRSLVMAHSHRNCWC